MMKRILIPFLIPCALMASSIDETYERVESIQQGLLVMRRDDALAKLTELYPDHALSKRLGAFLAAPSQAEEDFFSTFTPTDPFEERVKEVFTQHIALAQASKNHLLREGLVDIE